MSETTALLLVVLREGIIRRRIIDLGSIWSREGLSTLANELTAMLLDLSGQEVRARLAQLRLAQEEVGEHVADLIDDVDLQHSPELHRYGLAHILRQPELSDTDTMERVVGVLEQPGYLESILSDVGLSHRGVQIIIGGEDRWPEICDLNPRPRR